MAVQEQQFIYVRQCDRLQIGEGGTIRVEESVMQTGPKHTLYLAVGCKSKMGHEKPDTCGTE